MPEHPGSNPVVDKDKSQLTQTDPLDALHHVHRAVLLKVHWFDLSKKSNRWSLSNKKPDAECIKQVTVVGLSFVHRRQVL